MHPHAKKPSFNLVIERLLISGMREKALLNSTNAEVSISLSSGFSFQEIPRARLNPHI